MHFQSPLYLILLVLIPALALWYYRLGRKKQGTIQISSTIFTSIAMQRSGLMKKNIVVATYLIIMVLIILGIARPRKVDKIKETSVSVIDMLLVLDISSSMLADDFAPNRLEAVKNTAINFIDNRKEDRIGILVFAGESFIQCPLTIDKTILKSLISEIKVASKDYDGTAIGMAIANSINRLRESDTKSKTIILLSDGSNNQGELDPITAAGLAAKFDIKIYTVAAGTHGLAPYPVTDAWGRQVIQKVQVDVDEESLKEIAIITGGQFFRATDNKSLLKVYEDIDALERTEIEVKEYQNYTELYSWFTIPAAFASIFFLFFSRGIFHKLF